MATVFPKLSSSFPLFDKYPHILLSALISDTKLTPPRTFSQDSLWGIQYAFSRLTPIAQKLLWLRYIQELSLADVAVFLNLSETEASAIESQAILNLCRPGSWNYIQHGIAGNLREELTNCRRIAYRNGYCDGYHAAKAQTGSSLNRTANDCTIDMLPISERTKRCLRQKSLHKIQDLIDLSDQQITAIRGLGQKSATEIAVALEDLNIQNTCWAKYLL